MNKISIRDKNLVWAFSENYALKIPSEYVFEINSFYEKLIYAYLFTFEKYPIVFEYVKYLDKIDKHRSFSKMFFMYIENFIYHRSVEKRPIMEYYRNIFFENIKSFYRYNKRTDIVDELKYALSEKYFKKVPITTLMVRDLAQTFTDSKYLKDEVEIIETFEKIIDANFHFSLKEKNDNKGKQKFEIDKLKSFEKDKNVLDDYYGLIGSAEFTNDLNFEDMDHEEQKNKKNLEESFFIDREPIVKSIFGKSSLSEKNISELEKELCTKIHKDSRIIITNGEYDDSIESTFRKSQIDDSYIENTEYYDFLRNNFDREINNMILIIKNSLSMENEDHISKSRYGILKASMVYRNIYLNESKIFTKKYNYEKNDFSIDILIDSSASQLERKSSVAAQAFIITQAFTELNIPTRVLGYSNIENYLGLRIFREYSDDISANDNIFQFHPTGSNRDGLALKLVSKMISENGFERKLLIYLTDGKPNDVRQRVDNRQFHNQYRDKIAENDTAFEFRKLEQSGIYVLAIFTGNDKDIVSMKRIYGNNFAYIKNIKRFSKIVMHYIKNLIKN